MQVVRGARCHRAGSQKTQESHYQPKSRSSCSTCLSVSPMASRAKSPLFIVEDGGDTEEDGEVVVSEAAPLEGITSETTEEKGVLEVGVGRSSAFVGSGSGTSFRCRWKKAAFEASPAMMASVRPGRVCKHTPVATE
mmetsp:Transcript_13848/g.30187  ORF Transcript_13848/g.30187 Transcript_13848/m.30187 type:complete len:137 (-) Transcript_13848:1037-1447(-)